MSPTVQLLVATLVVVVASAYAGVRLMPAAWRRRVAAGAADMAMRCGLGGVLARRVESKLASGGACGSCDSCNACAAPVRAASDGAPTGPQRRIVIHPH